MQNLKTFFFIHKQSNVKTSGGQIKAERNLFVDLLMLTIEHEVNVKKSTTLSYPWALVTPDGIAAKTNKSRLIHILEKKILQPSSG